MKNIISFFSPDHRTGTSMLAQCCAERLAELDREKQILLVLSRGSGGTDYSPMLRESVGRLKPYLADRLINPEEIKRKSVWRANLSVIGGPDDPCGSSDIYPEMAEYLLRTLAPAYDAVICDGGADIEEGMALGSLFASDRLFMVLSQSENCMKRCEWLTPLYSQLELKADRFVINSFQAGSPYTESYVCDRLKIGRDRILKVRRSEFGNTAETDSRSLLSYRDKGFLKDIDELVAEIRNGLCT